MKKFLLVFALLSSVAAAQSKLPACQGKIIAAWNMCVGARAYSNGDKYVGEWQSGIRNGQGTYTNADGKKYVGEWKNGKQHGMGTLTYAGDRIPLEGIWENGQFVRTQKVGK